VTRPFKSSRAKLRQQAVQYPRNDYFDNHQCELRRWVKLRIDLENDLISVNDRSELISGSLDNKLRLSQTDYDYRTMKVYAHAVDGDNGLSPEIIDRHYVTASLLRGLPFLV
jgi:hypothetical protein